MDENKPAAKDDSVLNTIARTWGRLRPHRLEGGTAYGGSGTSVSCEQASEGASAKLRREENRGGAEEKGRCSKSPVKVKRAAKRATGGALGAPNKTSTRQLISAQCSFGVLRLGFLQDGDVGIGVFPEGGEVFVGANARTRAASASAPARFSTAGHSRAIPDAPTLPVQQFQTMRCDREFPKLGGRQHSPTDPAR